MIIKRKNKVSIIKLLGTILMILPISFLFIKKVSHVNSINKTNYEISKYIEETSINNKTEEIKEDNNQESLNYIAILEIPDISLKKGLLDINDKYNDVAYNIEVLSTSKMPNVLNSNLILAGHNGNSNISYFKGLSKITKDSLINIYYQGTKYIYKLNKSYEIDKTGEANIIRDRTINTLTLITCKDNSDTKQVIYIAYLISKETYWKICHNLLKLY